MAETEDKSDSYRIPKWFVGLMAACVPAMLGWSLYVTSQLSTHRTMIRSLKHAVDKIEREIKQ